MPRFRHDHPDDFAELLEDALDAADRAREEDARRRRVDLESRLRIARIMSNGPLTDV